MIQKVGLSPTRNLEIMLKTMENASTIKRYSYEEAKQLAVGVYEKLKAKTLPIFPEYEETERILRRRAFVDAAMFGTFQIKHSIRILKEGKYY